MIESINFRNPPITEAIIDLRVQPRDDLTIDELAFLTEEHQQYPVKESLYQHEGLLKFEAPHDPKIATKQSRIGFKYRSSDKHYVMQSQVNGFTLSRLAPYDRWESFQSEAQRLWKSYRDAVRPTSIKRLAVRYINKINIPGSEVELAAYFRTSPHLSPAIPQRMAGFALQVLLPLEDIRAAVRIHQAIANPESKDTTTIVLDIDIFRALDSDIFPTDRSFEDESDLWAFFEILRDKKNKIFRGCITEKAEELFK